MHEPRDDAQRPGDHHLDHLNHLDHIDHLDHLVYEDDGGNDDQVYNLSDLTFERIQNVAKHVCQGFHQSRLLKCRLFS